MEEQRRGAEEKKNKKRTRETKIQRKRKTDAERGSKIQTRREDKTKGKPDAGSGIIASSQNSSDKFMKDLTQQRLWIR
jgi:protein subunit release factor B